MSERDEKREKPPHESEDKPSNTAPDAVKDPSEKTGGKPGQGGSQGDEVDPGGG